MNCVKVVEEGMWCHKSTMSSLGNPVRPVLPVLQLPGSTHSPSAGRDTERVGVCPAERESRERERESEGGGVFTCKLHLLLPDTHRAGAENAAAVVDSRRPFIGMLCLPKPDL